MTEPAELKGAQETVRVRDDNGVIAASFQAAKFPPIEVTGCEVNVFKTNEILGAHNRWKARC